MKIIEIEKELKKINKHFFLTKGDVDYGEEDLITIKYIKNIKNPYNKNYNVSIVEFNKDDLYDFNFNYFDGDFDETPFYWNNNKERYKLLKLVLRIVEEGINDIENI